MTTKKEEVVKGKESPVKEAVKEVIQKTAKEESEKVEPVTREFDPEYVNSEKEAENLLFELDGTPTVAKETPDFTDEEPTEEEEAFDHRTDDPTFPEGHQKQTDIKDAIDAINFYDANIRHSERLKKEALARFRFLTGTDYSE